MGFARWCTADPQTKECEPRRFRSSERTATMGSASPSGRSPLSALFLIRSECVRLPCPKLPEVETMVRGIRAAVESRKLLDVELPPCAYRPISIAPAFEEIRERVAGRRVSRCVRRAKRVVLELESGRRVCHRAAHDGADAVGRSTRSGTLAVLLAVGGERRDGGARDQVRPRSRVGQPGRRRRPVTCGFGIGGDWDDPAVGRRGAARACAAPANWGRTRWR